MCNAIPYKHTTSLDVSLDRLGVATLYADALHQPLLKYKIPFSWIQRHTDQYLTAHTYKGHYNRHTYMHTCMHTCRTTAARSRMFLLTRWWCSRFLANSTPRSICTIAHQIVIYYYCYYYEGNSIKSCLMKLFKSRQALECRALSRHCISHVDALQDVVAHSVWTSRWWSLAL